MNIELAQLEMELAEIKTPSEVQKKKLKNERNYYEEERSKLKASIDFNGTRFGKGRYKAVTKDEPLDLG